MQIKKLKKEEIFSVGLQDDEISIFDHSKIYNRTINYDNIEIGELIWYERQVDTDEWIKIKDPLSYEEQFREYCQYQNRLF